jgi:hypothetical protein
MDGVKSTIPSDKITNQKSQITAVRDKINQSQKALFE